MHTRTHVGTHTQTNAHICTCKSSSLPVAGERSELKSAGTKLLEAVWSPSQPMHMYAAATSSEQKMVLRSSCLLPFRMLWISCRLCAIYAVSNQQSKWREKKKKVAKQNMNQKEEEEYNRRSHTQTRARKYGTRTLTRTRTRTHVFIHYTYRCFS